MVRWLFLPLQLFPPAAMRGSSRNLSAFFSTGAFTSPFRCAHAPADLAAHSFLDTIEQHAQRQEVLGEGGSCWSVQQPKSVARQGLGCQPTCLFATLTCRSTTGLTGAGLRWSPTASPVGRRAVGHRHHNGVSRAPRWHSATQSNDHGAALKEARRRKERTCPELAGDGGRARLVVLGC